MENCPIIILWIYLNIWNNVGRVFLSLLMIEPSVDGHHPVRDVHRPGPQHPDEPESAALHLLRHSNHGLSHRDSRDSDSAG